MPNLPFRTHKHTIERILLICHQCAGSELVCGKMSVSVRAVSVFVRICAFPRNAYEWRLHNSRQWHGLAYD